MRKITAQPSPRRMELLYCGKSNKSLMLDITTSSCQHILIHDEKKITAIKLKISV
jgi:hypothetical protein